ncbi:hypothetical protein [Amycolatopsis sp. La24]|uniref:hypothetical protein n=1 Tax=Amycolatopsis sp. La24 TaxID=3028304 RepID=UPI0023B07F54|nr:hypothetical protein [Amycolatopsis sp. La24]
MPIVETVTAAFTAPGAHVLLIDLDTATTPGADAAATTSVPPVTAAREAVRALGRTADSLAVNGRDDGTGSSRPFWADLVTDARDPSAAPAGVPSRTAALQSGHAPVPGSGSRVDLVLVSLSARAAESVSLDSLALLAADRLRHGGTFVVYTHSDWTEGRLADPTGAIVAAAQHADLLYLQHIVALHTPVRKGRLPAAPSPAAAADYYRARHRATVRGLPAPHLRAHGDVLVFAQPADPGEAETSAPIGTPAGGIP